MCGPSRPSTGHRIAIMFSSPIPSLSSSRSSIPSSSPEPGAASPAIESYSLSFQDAEQRTKAVFRSKNTDITAAGLFRDWRGIELRIERHGDLTQATTVRPLHQFQLVPPVSVSTKSNEDMEFSLPERLDLNVSDKGIVGRQVTVVARGETGEVLQLGNGIVGFD
ncbi:uncharacterized protein BDV17DRAFT_5194 [Aspergillus undulatus]|uniref:uncharacterized protein n=1 Tax=Aspergillus undulatus TaxID=1810928 RepID=UPI003CCDBC64